MSYDLEILVNGKSVTKYPHEGHTYIEGRKGSDYTLRFHNNTARRVIAVFSVDGLSVMHGKEAKFSDPGYVVAPFSTLTVPGWRLDNETVAKFKFGDRGKSYAAKKGEPLNVGVIGCVVFEEEVASSWFLTMGPATVVCNSRAVGRGLGGPDPHFSYCCDSSSTGKDQNGETLTSGSVLRSSTADNRACATGTVIRACNASYHPDSATSSVQVPVGNLGTEFGKKDHHAVQEVDVKRAAHPSMVIELHYDSRAGLEARGIQFKNVANVARAFPSESYGIGCVPPDGWKGQ